MKIKKMNLKLFGFRKPQEVIEVPLDQPLRIVLTVAGKPVALIGSYLPSGEGWNGRFGSMKNYLHLTMASDFEIKRLASDDPNAVEEDPIKNAFNVSFINPHQCIEKGFSDGN